MRFLIFFTFLFLLLVAGSPVYAAVNPIPSAHCLSSTPCVTILPTPTAANAPATNGTAPSGTSGNTQTISSPSTAPLANPSPTVPCSTTQSAAASEISSYHEKHRAPTQSGDLQQFIQLLLQLLQLLFQQLGIQVPITNPCGTSPVPTAAPTIAPTQQPSTAPTSGGGQTPSSAPTGNPTPTIFGTSPSPSPATTPGTTGSGFITASGTQLMLNGKPYKSLSFNISPLGACWISNWTTAEMDSAFSAMPSGSLVRFFAPDDSGDSAAFVQSIVKEADKYNIHLIIALADADTDNGCDTDDAAGSQGKTAAYYTDAIKPGSNWENWVKSVVPPLANDPGVAIWEISNEPVHTGSTLSSGVSMSTFQTYIDTAAAYIRSFDKNHLVSIAPADLQEFGGASGAESLFKNLDVIDDHDYAWDYQNHATISSDFATEKQISQALNKPFMVDEAGVEGGSSCNGSNGLSLSARSTYLITKANDYLSSSGGASAVVIWLYTGGSGGGCAYENINTSDPLVSAVKNYVMPN